MYTSSHSTSPLNTIDFFLARYLTVTASSYPVHRPCLSLILRRFADSINSSPSNTSTISILATVDDGLQKSSRSNHQIAVHTPYSRSVVAQAAVHRDRVCSRRLNRNADILP